MKKDLVVIDAQPSLLKRLTQVITYGFTGGWFSPQQPIAPQQPETAGRAYDYPPGYNLNIRPRRDSGISFEMLRGFANSYDLLRLVIETRKDQIAAFDWSCVPKDQEPGSKTDPAMEAKLVAVEQFFKSPDGRTTWHAWLRAVLEDHFVLDANIFWPTYKGGVLERLEMVDPSTIMKFIDDSGRMPEPPLPAFRQVLHGIPTSEYKKDELYYFINNVRSNTLYGFSAVEQILMTINIGLRREVSQLQFFTEGNIPEAIAGVPETWTPQQISQFQSMWDAVLAGDTAARHHMKFVPNDATKVLQLKPFEATLKSEFDEWIVRIICYAFSVPPTPFIKQMNRATAETATATAKEEGLQPLLDYLKDMFDSIIVKCLGIDDVEFMWNMEEEQDAQTQSAIDDLYIKNGVWSIDEVRQRMGLDALGVENMIFTPKGPMPVSMFNDGSAIALLTAGGAQQQEGGDPNSQDGSKGKGSANGKSGKTKQPSKDGKGGSAGNAQKFRKRFGYTFSHAYRSSHSTITKRAACDIAKNRT